MVPSADEADEADDAGRSRAIHVACDTWPSLIGDQETLSRQELPGNNSKGKISSGFDL
jgi:hypothetical protein